MIDTNTIVKSAAIFGGSFALYQIASKRLNRVRTRRQDRKEQIVANIAMYTK